MNNRKRIHFVLWLTILLVVGILRISLAAGYEKVPVLMIHGLYGTPLVFNTLKTYLINHGYNGNTLYSPQMVDNTITCSRNHLDQINAEVEEIVRKTGSQRIDIVGYSRGGLNILCYMHFGNGVNRVRNWVSIGGSNVGRDCSSVFGPLLEDLTPGSSTLYTAIYSASDTIVRPEWTIIPGARNVELTGISHLQLPSNTEVIGHVLEALQGNGLNEDGSATHQPSAPTGLKVLPPY